VPASGGATEAQIGADEVSVPVVEDEVVVQTKQGAGDTPRETLGQRPPAWED
jgi:hypothetical protein